MSFWNEILNCLPPCKASIMHVTGIEQLRAVFYCGRWVFDCASMNL